MKCLICNTEVKKGARKCPTCGFKIDNTQDKEFKKEEMFSNKKELNEDKYHTIVLLQEQLDSIKELLEEDEKKENINKKVKKETKVQSSKKKNSEKEKTDTIVLLQSQLDTIRELLDEDNKKAEKEKKVTKETKSQPAKKKNTDADNNTIVLLQSQLNTIRELLDEDEKKEKANKRKTKDKITKINKDNVQEEIVKDIEEVSKELEKVTQDLEENKEYIELIRAEEKEHQEKIKTAEEEKSESIEEKILKTAPIDKLADAIAGEIVEGINSYNDEIEKTKELNLSLEKTVAIKSLGDTKELDKFSLIDDINRQIEKTNEEVNSNEDVVVRIEESIEENTKPKEENKEDVDVLSTRRKVFLFTGIAILILIFTLMTIWVVAGINNKNTEATVDYLTRLNKAMETYYETEEIDDILYVLEEVKNDKEETKKLQAKTRTICDSWVLLYLNEEVEDKEAFEEATNKYKGLLEGLYRYAIVKNDTNLVRALTEKDYNDLLIQFDDIYSDSAIFYDALELYNSKDYNKAYYMFDRIESNNSYYEKSVTYCNLIISNILDTILNDISKLEKNIDTLDNASKLEVYSNIEQIIIDYNSIYSNIDLTQNDKYQELLSEYTSKVSEYTDKVLNEINSQGSVT